MVSTTYTLSEIKSQEFIDHTQKHFITTSPFTYYVTCGSAVLMHVPNGHFPGAQQA